MNEYDDRIVKTQVTACLKYFNSWVRTSKEYTINQITEATGISKTSLYRYLDKAN